MRSSARWTALWVGISLMFLVSCTTVSNRVDRYESDYKYEYGPAQQNRKQPRVVRCEDENVLMFLGLRDLHLNMDFQIYNKSGGSMTINWQNVLFKLPKGDRSDAFSGSGDHTVIPARGQFVGQFGPTQDLSLFGIDSEETQETLGNVYSDDRIIIRMPVRRDTTGETRIYLVTYRYRPGTVDLAGDCATMD